MPEARIEIFRDLDSENTETIICVDVNGKKFRFLENGFHNSVNCDVAVITDSFTGDFSKLKYSECYANSEYLEQDETAGKYCSSFEDSLKIEIDISESEYIIYEP